MTVDKRQDKFQKEETILSASGGNAYPGTGLRQVSAAPSQPVDYNIHVRHLDIHL